MIYVISLPSDLAPGWCGWIGLLVGFAIFPAEAPAQDGLLLQWEPTLSYTRKVNTRWEANIQVNAQQSLTPPIEANSGRRYHLNYAQTQLFATYTWRTNLKLSGGYSFRANDATETLTSHNHRLMEQLAFLSYLRGRRWANRLRLEQRFQDKGYVSRWRYRISFDVPLNGEQLNPGEKYLVASNEWLFSFASQRRDHQNRFYVGVGWYSQARRKIETGLQYRLGGIGTGTAEHVLWFTTAFYWSQ